MITFSVTTLIQEKYTLILLICAYHISMYPTILNVKTKGTLQTVFWQSFGNSIVYCLLQDCQYCIQLWAGSFEFYLYFVLGKEIFRKLPTSSVYQIKYSHCQVEYSWEISFYPFDLGNEITKTNLIDRKTFLICSILEYSMFNVVLGTSFYNYNG